MAPTSTRRDLETKCEKCHRDQLEARVEYTAFRRLCEECMRVQLREGPEDPKAYKPLPPDYDEPNPHSPAPLLKTVRCTDCNEWVNREHQFLLRICACYHRMYCLYCARKHHISDEVDADGKLKGKASSDLSEHERYFERMRVYTRARDGGMPM